MRGLFAQLSRGPSSKMGKWKQQQCVRVQELRERPVSASSLLCPFLQLCIHSSRPHGLLLAAGIFPPPTSSPPLQASFSGSVSLLPVARSRCLFRKRKQISLLQRCSQNLFLKVNLWERASPKMRLSVLLSRECGQEVLTSPSPGKRSRFEPSSRYAGSRAKLPESTQEARGTGQQHSSCFLYASLGCKACLEHGGCSVEWMGTSGLHLRPEACRDSSSASGYCSLGCSCL